MLCAVSGSTTHATIQDSNIPVMYCRNEGLYITVASGTSSTPEWR